MIDAGQLRELVVRPALKQIGMYSEAAEALVMGTAAQESRLRYIKQLGGGPALGLFQMEPRTHDDIWHNWIAHRPEVKRLIFDALKISDDVERPLADRLVWDLKYAAMLCRIHYRRIPEPLPEAPDVWAQAFYWKRFYNTELGAGKPQEFVDNYRLIQ